jgi:prevent-host-death family protein
VNQRANVKPITYLKNRTADVVRQVSEEGQTLTITQNGEAKVVVMDVEIYDQWQRTTALLKILAHAEADVDAGRTLSQADAFRRAETSLRRATRSG